MASLLRSLRSVLEILVARSAFLAFLLAGATALGKVDVSVKRVLL